MTTQQIIGYYTQQHSALVPVDSYNYEDQQYTKHILVAMDDKRKFYTITLWTEHGMCMSGWTTASWGHCEFSEVDSSVTDRITHIPKETLPSIDLEEMVLNCDDGYYTDIFQCSFTNMSYYYPRGKSSVKEELFCEGRVNYKRKLLLHRNKRFFGAMYLLVYIPS